MTPAQKHARIRELVRELAELLQVEPTPNEKPLERPRVVVDDLARARASKALAKHGITPKRGRK